MFVKWTKEQYRSADATALEARRAELLAVSGDATIPTDDLEAESRAYEAEVEFRNAYSARMRGQVAQALEAPARPVVQAAEERSYDASSPEYRTAWLKARAADMPFKVGFSTAMTDAERRSYTYLSTDDNVAAIMPTETRNRIIELVTASSTIYRDITNYPADKVYQVPRHTAILENDAAFTNENTANGDEKDNFDYITLTGLELRKQVKVGRKMMIQTIDAFEAWLVNHLATRMLNALDLKAIALLSDDTKGMSAANKGFASASAATVTDDDLLNLFAHLDTKGEAGGRPVMYANYKTVWSYLANVKDDNGRPLYKDSTDTAFAMRIHGVGVKQEDNLPDGVILLGYPSLIEGAMFEDVNFMRDIDVATRETIIAGYALWDMCLTVPTAFAKLTVSGGALTLSASTATIAAGASTTVTVSGNKGAVTASSDNEAVTVTVSGTTVTIAVAAGTAASSTAKVTVMDSRAIPYTAVCAVTTTAAG